MNQIVKVTREKLQCEIVTYEVPELNQRYVWNPARGELTIGAMGVRFQPCEIKIDGKDAITKHQQLEIAHKNWLKYTLETMQVYLYALGREEAGSLVEQAIVAAFEQQGDTK